MKSQKPYWVVWSFINCPPTVKHDTQQAAIAEAQRLARHHHGVEFVVLEAIAAYQKLDLIETLFDGTPF